MRSSANDGQLRSPLTSSQQSNMLLFKLTVRTWGNNNDVSSNFVLSGAKFSFSDKTVQQELVFPSPEHETVSEDSALLLHDPEELPDIRLIY